MSTKVGGPQGPVVSSRDELVAYLEQGSKPARDWRIGTEHEKFGFYRRGYGPVPYDGERGIRALLETLDERFCGDAVTENGNIIARPPPGLPEGRHDQPRAGRPARTLGRAAGEPARNLRGASPASRRGRRGRPRTRHRLSRHRLLAEMDARRDADDAEAALPHHGALHADARPPRARHDVPHRDGAGELGFQRRARHGAKNCAPGSRSSRSRPRSSPIPPSPTASRTASSPSAPKSGATPIPTAPGSFLSPSSRAWALSAMSIMRSACRCISSIATGAISTWRAPRSKTSSAASSPPFPGFVPRSTTGPIISPRCSPM